MTEIDIVEKIIRAKTLYSVLGVEKTANNDEIKKAYRRSAAQVHPDRCRHPKATEAFQRLSHAYQTLSDSEKRKIYDMTGEENGRQRPQAQYRQGNYYYREEISPEELFNSIFGGGLFGMYGFGNPYGFRYQRYRPQNNNNNREDGQKSICSRFAFIIIIFLLMNSSSLFSFFSPSFSSLKKADVREVIFFRRPDGIQCEMQESSHFKTKFYVPTWWINEQLRSRDFTSRSKFLTQLREYADDFWLEDLEIECELEKNRKGNSKTHSLGPKCKAFQKASRSKLK